MVLVRLYYTSTICTVAGFGAKPAPPVEDLRKAAAKGTAVAAVGNTIKQQRQ